MKHGVINDLLFRKIAYSGVFFYFSSLQFYTYGLFLSLFTALEKVKEMLRRRDSRASSSSTADTADILRVVSANPWEVPGTNDCKFKNLFEFFIHM